MIYAAIVCLSFCFFCLFPLNSYSSEYDTTTDGCEVVILSTWDLEGSGNWFKDECVVPDDEIKEGKKCRCVKFKITNTTGNQFKVTGITALFFDTVFASGKALPESSGSRIMKPGQSKIIEKFCVKGPSPIKDIWCTRGPVPNPDNSSQKETSSQKPAIQAPKYKSKLRKSPDGTWTN